MLRMALGTELADEIAERAVGKAKLARDVGQGTPVQEEGTQGFVAALLRLLGLAEELLAAQVIHDRPSKVSSGFQAKRCRKG
jgi:hypothetical protein